MTAGTRTAACHGPHPLSPNSHVLLPRDHGATAHTPFTGVGARLALRKRRPTGSVKGRQAFPRSGWGSALPSPGPPCPPDGAPAASCGLPAAPETMHETTPVPRSVPRRRVHGDRKRTRGCSRLGVGGVFGSDDSGHMRLWLLGRTPGQWVWTVCEVYPHKAISTTTKEPGEDTPEP